MRLPHHRFLNNVYAWAAVRVKDRARWQADLEAPPRVEPKATRQARIEAMDDHGASFMEAFAQAQAEGG